MRAAALLAAALPLLSHAGGPLRPDPLRGGIEFQGADIRGLQADEFANPASLWIEGGARLWNEKRGTRGVSCASCHGADAKSMEGIAVRYPRYSRSLGSVVDLEQQIAACVERNEAAPRPAYESQELLSLSAFVASRSRGLAISPDLSTESQAAYERGRALYFERQGQLNLACTNCHDASWGKRLLAETVSQGHPADWPAYRLEWQAMGSIERRLRACYLGVRAEMPPYGSGDLVALEVYLSRRAQGLVSHAPGVRR
ncbi:MAG TPA: sulfur oxidation c-type cytochrome SoxA [Usitatibacter sp.]|jgi:sulfur-oxidizing protein SoxA|nr:sulfur oxidation c-type cytochrome SoxA [Usitatibacter sp.]